MLKMGFIGNGKSTNRYHLPFILERDNIEVKTIYNRNPKTATWDKIEGVHYTTDLDELLKRPRNPVNYHLYNTKLSLRLCQNGVRKRQKCAC